MPQKKIYFQWQNEALLKTIYPLRTMNLRNALEYYMEIDLWEQLRNKKIEDMPEEVAAYHKKKAAVIKQAKQDYETRLSYFYETTIQPEAAKLLDEYMLARINALHDAFNAYYRDYTDPFRQSYFITQRLAALDKNRKDLDQKISTQLRRLNIMKEMDAKNPRIQIETEILDKLRNTQPVFDEWRKKLVELISAFGKLEGRKKDYVKQADIALKRKKEIDKTLVPAQSKIALQQARRKELQDDVQRLRKHLQPERTPVENYFAVPDAITDIASHFPQTDPEFIGQILSVHAEIAALHDPAVKLARLRHHIFSLQLNRVRFERRTDSIFKENTLKAFDEVLDQLKDFWSMLDSAGKTEGQLKEEIKVKEQESDGIQSAIASLKKATAGWEREIQELNERVLEVTEENYISEYRPVPPTMKDIIEMKLDEYRETVLKVEGQDRDQHQLLALLIERFKKEPGRYPRWLQYMIVHFSGMRYASSHGSWADPKDLYLSLRIAAINKDLSAAELDDFAVEEMCRQKVAAYTGELRPETDADHEVPALANAEDEESKQRIEGHLALLQREDPYSRRRGLLNLLLDEEDHEIQSMTEQDALEALEDLRAKQDIPDWMWKELSALTQLRLTEAKDDKWDKLTPEEQAAKNSAQWSKYREMMNKWKQDHLTGWREEHDRSNELIVSRAVCNEVAENILHLRGHHGPAGLSSAQDWFLNAAKKAEKLLAQEGPANGAAYFVKPKKKEDVQYYRPGAGILWLKYRNDEPPLWNVVKPFVTVGGDKLLPDTYLNGGRWSYKNGGLDRSRTFKNDKGLTVKSTQYLYWVHIATVAEVAEAAEGETIVLTYETNLPYEDRRLSCVGVFKRYLHNLLYDGGEDTYNASYVGYVPDNPPEIPDKDLDEMLDWDHILLKPKRTSTRKREPTK